MQIFVSVELLFQFVAFRSVASTPFPSGLAKNKSKFCIYRQTGLPKELNVLKLRE